MPCPTAESLVMLGTGSAFPKYSYNSCFAIRTPRLLWLTDAGGGNRIFDVLSGNGIDLTDVHYLFITHAHTDHILGAVWVVRGIVNLVKEKAYDGTLHLYANAAAANALVEICRLTFLQSDFAIFRDISELTVVGHGDRMRVGDVAIEFFDCGSKAVEQTGYRMLLPSGITFATLGDEALSASNVDVVRDTDYVVCGAFCLQKDAAIFRPYEKHHLTVSDVASTAATAGIANLIIVHSEDSTPDRKKNYIDEARLNFSGNIIIPADGEIISLI